MKFPPEFSTKVDLGAVNWDTMKPWIARRITELLGGLEDEVLIGYVVGQLEGKKVRGVGGLGSSGGAGRGGNPGVHRPPVLRLTVLQQAVCSVAGCRTVQCN